MSLELAKVQSDALIGDEILRSTRVRVEKLCQVDREKRRGVAWIDC